MTDTITAIKKALETAEQFIVNGVELGYIRMPDPATPDSAHQTLPIIRQAFSTLTIKETALDFDAVYVIPREMTDEEWWEVKYNVDRKANPDIDLWRIKDAVRYANFIAGHRGRAALSSTGDTHGN